jgi:hypothetical protein
MDTIKQFISNHTTKIIKQYLGKYFSGLDTPLKESEKLVDGNLVLSNLKIKKEAFNSSNLGFSFTFGFISSFFMFILF